MKKYNILFYRRFVRLLKKKRFVIGVPVVIRFRRKDTNQLVKVPATKGTYVVKWEDILKTIRQSK